MSKKVTEHKFYVVDLVRNKPKCEYISIPPYRVDVTIKIETKKAEVPSAKLKRLEEAARKSLEDTEKKIIEVAIDYEKKIGDLLAKENENASAEAGRLIQGANVAIQGALKSAEAAALKACEKKRAEEAKRDELLREAKIFVVLKVGKAGLKVTSAVTRYIATGGVDVTGLIFAAKACYTAYKAIDALLADEKKLANALVNGADKYLAVREKRLGAVALKQVPGFTNYSKDDPQAALKTLAERAEALSAQNAGAAGGTSKATFLQMMAKKLKEAVAGELSGVETARKNYRNGTTKFRQKVDSLSSKSDGLNKEVKKVPALIPAGPKGKKLNAEAIKLAAAAMSLQGNVTKMSKSLEQRLTYLDDMQTVLAKAGLVMSDKSFADKVKGFDPSTISKEVGNAKFNIDTIKAIVKNVEKIAA